MKKIDELRLIAQCALGDSRQAFGQLVEAYQSQLRRFLMNLTGGDEMLTDDLAQETFLKAYVNVRNFKGLSSFATWLYRIAYNVFYDYTRSHKITEEIDQAVALRQANSGDTALQLDLQQALSILSPAERSCITLQLMEGQPIDKISEITEMAEGTMKSHLSRGKQKLAMFLRKNGYS